jgi:hypothetical protein
MSFSDETLMAYADGELDTATRAQIEAAMATDAALAQRVERHRQLRARLQGAFQPVLDEPLPPRLLESAQRFPGAGADNVVLLRRTSAPRWSWPQWGAMAASLLVGALGAALLLTPPGGPIITRNGEMLASGALARALSAQLASRQSHDALVQIGVSFRARSGGYCRSFVLRDKTALAGLACGDSRAWRLQILSAAAAPSGAGPYHAAASAMPPELAQAIDALIAGEPLDAQAEAAARARGWRP